MRIDKLKIDAAISFCAVISEHADCKQGSWDTRGGAYCKYVRFSRGLYFGVFRARAKYAKIELSQNVYFDRN